MFSDAVEEYRERRRRGTRIALEASDWLGLLNIRLLLVVIVVPVGIGVLLLTESGPWPRILGALLVLGPSALAGALIRWLMRPEDPDSPRSGTASRAPVRRITTA